MNKKLIESFHRYKNVCGLSSKKAVIKIAKENKFKKQKIIKQIKRSNFPFYEKVLKKDKASTLEGRISEELFMLDVYPVLQNKGCKVSLDWWVVKTKKKLFFFKYQPTQNFKLNKPDQKVANLLKKNGFSYYLSYYDADKRQFVFKNKNGKVFSEKQLKSCFATRKQSVNNPNKKRQNTVIKHLINSGLFTKFAKTRNFVTNFLAKHFYNFINLDAVLIKDNKFKIIEIKYKYPSRAKKYGINLNPTLIFKHLLQNGFDSLEHYILLNSTYDKHTSIIDLLSQRIKTDWWHKTLSVKEINEAIENDTNYAPSETSIYGNHQMSVTYYDMYKFSKFKRLGKVAYDLIEEKTIKQEAV